MRAVPIKRAARFQLGIWLLGLGFSAFLLVFFLTPLPPGRTALATVLYDRQGGILTTLYAENRQPVRLEEVPVFLRRAIVATEDAGFYRHIGISPRGIARAAWRDLTHGRLLEGASTITQQLARGVYLSPRRTFWRKLVEALYALKMELHLTKDEILTRYLNQVYFGDGAYGVKTAARTYFTRAPVELNEAEQAFLAGLLQSPENYNPWRHPKAARGRFSQVLARMRDCGHLDREAAVRVAALPLRFCRPVAKPPRAPYFCSYVRDFLAGLLPEGVAGVYRAGLQVQTTLDPAWQSAAEAALARLATLGRNGPEGCLVALDPETGAVRAIVGGRDYARSPFNRATQARRQPGSAFKPIVYADALEHGYTLATLKDCAARTFQLGADTYTPADAGRPFHEAALNLRDALATSCNVVAVAIGAELGPTAVADFAARLGITSPLRPYLSLPLGTSELSPLELACVYAVFANGGRRIVPYGVVAVRTADGRLLYRSHSAGTRAIGASTAFLLTQALTGVFGPEGTAAGLNPGRPAAGKTGTSDGNRDAWFAGYTPDLAAVVQIGYDQPRPLPGSGGSLAAPVWTDFVRRALYGRPALGFPMPDDVRSLLICRETGDLAGPGCPARSEYFAHGTEPAVVCARHRLLELLVCARSHLLPGLHCRELEPAAFRPGEEPTETCHVCRGSILEWLERLFKRRRAEGKEEPARPEPIQPAPSEPRWPFNGQRTRPWETIPRPRLRGAG